MPLKLKVKVTTNITDLFNIQNYNTSDTIKAFGKVTLMITICDLKL